MIGVLALQGAFEAHGRSLEALGHEVTFVRSVRALAECDGLVLPGGESTVHLKLLERDGLRAPLAAFVASGRPVLATCAGLILAASRVLDPEQESFGFLDVTVRRNGWGRQLASFEARDDGDEIPVVAIRAPRIVLVGPRVRVLATFRGEPILVRENNVTGATFHPELTDDLTVHRSVFGEGARGRAEIEAAPITRRERSRGVERSAEIEGVRSAGRESQGDGASRSEIEGVRSAGRESPGGGVRRSEIEGVRSAGRESPGDGASRSEIEGDRIAGDGGLEVRRGSEISHGPSPRAPLDRLDRAPRGLLAG